jgi:peptidoglycan/xylan/chitin deacetylase (PgdA/CDA1 family)
MHARTPVRRLSLLALLTLGLFFAGCNDWSWLCRLWPSAPTCNDRPLKVNLQIDAEQEEGTTGIQNIVDELKRRGLSATIFVTADWANRNGVAVNRFYQDGFEIALHGYYTAEQLATMTYDEQKDLLTRAKQAVEGCQPCGNFRPVTGFRPQYFSQNDDTYRVLDELGLTYDGGFKARLLFLEGHDADAAPYAAAGRAWSAVPLTTVDYQGQLTYVCDIAAAQAAHLTAAQWTDVLRSAHEQALAADEPLVVLFHGWYTGDRDQYDYWQPFVDFLDEIEAQAQFLTTQELVDAYAP